MKKYKAVQPYTKEEAEAIFAQGTGEEITYALLGVTYYVEDWQWVQAACLALLDCSDISVHYIAILCLGHLATFHNKLDLAIVLPVLQAHVSDPALAGTVSNVFSDIAMAIKFNPSLVESWHELPQELKDALIKERVFNSAGKRIRER